jgi:protein-disulfide isomerase
MSLTLKLLSTTLLLSSFLYASTQADKVEDFLDDKFMENSRLKSVDVKVSDVIPLKKVEGWNAYILDVKAYLKSQPKKQIKQRMIWFSNGTVITKDLTDMQTGESLINEVKPSFKDSYYTKANLIFGNPDAKHKVAIFSDPLCPFCKGFVPGALKYMKKHPEKFAVYYYHFPLERLHPASVTLVKAAVAAELQGNKDVVEKLYKVKINSQEKDQKKILKAFNAAVGTHITIKDIETPAVKKQLKHDFDTANTVMVAGTPTMYLDNKVDRTKKKYLKVK